MAKIKIATMYARPKGAGAYSFKNAFKGWQEMTREEALKNEAANLPENFTIIFFNYNQKTGNGSVVYITE